MLRLLKFNANPDGTLGVDLSRAPWDPYPWISNISSESNAYAAGLRIGDTLLELNGYNVLGLRILQIVELLKNSQRNQQRAEAQFLSNGVQDMTNTSSHGWATTALIWRYKTTSAEEEDKIQPTRQSEQRKNCTVS